MSRANDAYIAEHVMGWTQVRVQALEGRNRRVWVGCPSGSANDLTHVPHFSTSLDRCYEMETRLMARGLMMAYAMQLEEVTLKAGNPTYSARFKLIHATPQQKVAAALAVVGVIV